MVVDTTSVREYPEIYDDDSNNIMKVAFIHNEKKTGTGANYINDLMFLKLQEAGVEVKNFYPAFPWRLLFT